MSEWLIPEDGIIDALAVRIAASGQRRVRLTLTERRLAAALIVTRGGTPHQIAEHLGISRHRARDLAASITADPPDLGEVAA